MRRCSLQNDRAAHAPDSSQEVPACDSSRYVRYWHTSKRKEGSLLIWGDLFSGNQRNHWKFHPQNWQERLLHLHSRGEDVHATRAHPQETLADRSGVHWNARLGGSQLCKSQEVPLVLHLRRTVLHGRDTPKCRLAAIDAPSWNLKTVEWDTNPRIRKSAAWGHARQLLCLWCYRKDGMEDARWGQESNQESLLGTRTAANKPTMKSLSTLNNWNLSVNISRII